MRLGREVAVDGDVGAESEQFIHVIVECTLGGSRQFFGIVGVECVEFHAHGASYFADASSNPAVAD